MGIHSFRHFRASAAVGPAAAAVGLALAVGWAVPAHAADSLNDALVGGRLHLDARYRFERVDQQGFPKKAYASTLRTRLGYETGEFADLSAYAEVDDVRAIGNDLYNSTVNGRTDRPVVADPEEVLELNQAYVQYRGKSGSPVPDTMARVGRQRITYDNHRFIGNVTFRQNEQTYDAVRLSTAALRDTTLDYVFVDKVHRIFSDESPAGNHPIDAHLFRGEYAGLGLGTVVAYAWVLDYERPAQFGLSSATFGARFKGAHPIRGELDLLYTAEYAHQIDNADNPADFSLNYVLGEVGARYRWVTGSVAYEVLGSDGVNAVQTPLATGHAHQGWADQFLTTPAAGIEDLIVSLGANVKGVKGKVVYHDFTAEEGGADLAHEWDAILSKTVLDHVTLELKFAKFESDGFGVDVEKAWASVIVKY